MRALVIRYGILQGEVLLPLLRTILVDDLLRKLWVEGFYCLGYADVLTIIVRGKFASSLSEGNETALKTVDNW